MCLIAVKIEFFLINVPVLIEKRTDATAFVRPDILIGYVARKLNLLENKT